MARSPLLLPMALLAVACGDDPTCLVNGAHYELRSTQISGTCELPMDPDFVYVHGGDIEHLTSRNVGTRCQANGDPAEDLCSWSGASRCLNEQVGVWTTRWDFDFWADGSGGSGWTEYAISTIDGDICTAAYRIDFSLR